MTHVHRDTCSPQCELKEQELSMKNLAVIEPSSPNLCITVGKNLLFLSPLPRSIAVGFSIRLTRLYEGA